MALPLAVNLAGALLMLVFGLGIAAGACGAWPLVFLFRARR